MGSGGTFHEFLTSALSWRKRSTSRTGSYKTNAEPHLPNNQRSDRAPVPFSGRLRTEESLVPAGTESRFVQLVA
jgi:hypothetical protein